MTEQNSRPEIAVLTDTNADLTAEFAGDLPIFTLPLRITDGVHEYRDTVDITVEDVYRRQKTEDFKTSLPATGDIEAVLDRIRNLGFRKVIVLLIADSLSSASNLLRITAEDREDLEIAVFNSCSGSVGCGILAWQAAKFAATGMAFDALKAKTETLIRDTEVFFSIDTLEYLRRGGRIGRAAELVTSVLQIKPVLSFDRTGTIYTAAKVRGRKLLKKCLIDCVRKVTAAAPGVPYNLVLCDGGCPEEGAALEEELKVQFPDYCAILHGNIDATLAVHLGPNLLGAGVQLLR